MATERAPARLSKLPPGCGFAAPGTYGHECGAPATKVGIKKATTRNGIFYARRCEACSTIKGGDNAGVERWEPFDPVSHVNVWS